VGGCLVYPQLSDASRVTQVTILWERCVPVSADPEVLTWIRATAIDATFLSEDLARALPRDLALPEWASYGNKPWNVDGYRLILPLYSPRGELQSLYARALRPVVLGTIRTAQSFPVIAGVGGRVMANDIGLRLLRTRQWPGDSTWRTVIIAGGAVDFLEWSTSVRAEGPAVLGIVPGSWTTAIADRIPDGSRVVVRAHQNPITGRYAHRVAEALQSRCEVIIRTAS
jgi:hypothetical protein